MNGAFEMAKFQIVLAMLKRLKDVNLQNELKDEYIHSLIDRFAAQITNPVGEPDEDVKLFLEEQLAKVDEVLEPLVNLDWSQAEHKPSEC